jgi:hypothetical protein
MYKAIARNAYCIKYLYNKLEHKCIRVFEQNLCIYCFDLGWKVLIYVAKYSVWKSMIYGITLGMTTQCYKGMTSVKYGKKWTFRATVRKYRKFTTFPEMSAVFSLHRNNLPTKGFRKFDAISGTLSDSPLCKILCDSWVLSFLLHFWQPSRSVLYI